MLSLFWNYIFLEKLKSHNADIEQLREFLLIMYRGELGIKAETEKELIKRAEKSNDYKAQLIGTMDTSALEPINKQLRKIQATYRTPWYCIYKKMDFIITIIAILAVIAWLISGRNSGVKKTIVRATQGSNATQLSTTGNGSPITTIGEQHLHYDSSKNNLSPRPSDIEELGKRVRNWYSKGGDRKSYEILLSWKNSENNPVIKKIVSSELRMIEELYGDDAMKYHLDRNFIFICRVRKTPGGHGCPNGFEPPAGYDAVNVLNHLLERRWEERARAACLLRNVKTSLSKEAIDKEKLYTGLIELMGNEENSLVASKMAFDTYKELADFNPKSGEVFAFHEAIDNWNDPKQREKILSKEF